MKLLHYYLLLLLINPLTISLDLCTSNPVAAQLVPDKSLGSESSRVTVEGTTNYRINGGATRGQNLFHSFQEFNVPEGNSAYFLHSPNITNIFTRVTGQNPSGILGTLGVLGNANLFLINPNGILFGPNAQLDLSGSFLASTADSLLFKNGFEFSAFDPQTPPLLTINIPIGLQFRENPGTILVEGLGLNQPIPDNLETVGEIVQDLVTFEQTFLNDPVGLQVQPGKTLALIGGNLILSGGLLKASSGRIELRSVADNSVVNLIPETTGFKAEYAGVANLQDITLAGQSALIASGFGGGDIQVQGRRITLSEGSQIRSNNWGVDPGKQIAINGSESVELIGTPLEGFLPSLIVAATTGPGTAGDVTIATGRLTVREGAIVGGATVGFGAGGNLSINAADRVEVTGYFENELFTIPSLLLETAFDRGHAGSVTIAAKQLRVGDGGAIAVGTGGTGNGGTLTVQTSDSVELIGGLPFDQPLFQTGLLAISQGSGDAGRVSVTTQRLTVSNGATIAASTTDRGRGGIIQVNADLVDLSGISQDGETPSSLLATTAGPGEAGDITIDAGLLQVRDGATIFVGTSNEFSENEVQGRGGNLTIQAREVAVIGASREGEISSSLGAGTVGNGNAGNVRIEVTRLMILEGGAIGVGASDRVSPLSNLHQSPLLLAGGGQGGNITVKAQEVLLGGMPRRLDVPSRLTALAQGTGNAGNISIETGRLTLQDGAQISVGTLGPGNGGNIAIQAQEVELVGSQGLGVGTFIGASTQGTPNALALGNAGNVEIEAGRLTIREGALVEVSSIFSRGNGGNLTVRSRQVELIGTSPDEKTPSGFNAATVFGPGDAGDVTIETEQLRIRDGAFMAANTSSKGQAGTLRVRALDSVELSGTSGSGKLPSFLAATTVGTGNAGNVIVDTRRLLIRNGAGIVTSSQGGSGNAGNVVVRAREIELRGISPTHQGSVLAATTGGGGNAGNITVETGRLLVRDGAGIIVGSIRATGNAGNITVRSQEVELRGLSPTDGSVSTLAAGTLISRGNAGSITIDTERLTLQDGANITVGTALSRGSAGNIVLRASSVELAGRSPQGQGSGLVANTLAGGDAGNVTVEADRLTVRDGAQINVNGRGFNLNELNNAAIDPAEFQTLLQTVGVEETVNQLGNPGNLRIQSREIRLDRQGRLVATSESGKGGNINLQARDILLRRGSEISAAGSQSNRVTEEGNININAETLTLLEDSRIITSASDPKGGSNIQISPVQGANLALLQSRNSTINAAGQLTIQGNLNFQPPDLPQVTVVDPQALVAQNPCQRGRESEFTITGRGGLPSNPNQMLNGDRDRVGLVDPVEIDRARSKTSIDGRTTPPQTTAFTQMIPARGWVRNAKGEVILVGDNLAAEGRGGPVSGPSLCEPLTPRFR